MNIGSKQRLMVAAGAAIFALSFLGAYRGVLPRMNMAVSWEHPDRWQYVPSATSGSATELALVYIGSSTCTPSNDPGLPDVVEQLKIAIQRKAAEGGRSFAAVGIARDGDAESGLRHLRKYGHFDEVMAGRGWHNIGVLKYVYQGIPGVAATPQVLVVERRVVGGDSTAIRDEHLVVRKVGVQEIRNWLESAVPLPPLAGLQAGPHAGVAASEVPKLE